MKILTSTAVALALATPAIAQDTMTIEVAESSEFGQYLTDAEGRPFHRFTADTQALGDRQAQISCTSEDCLESWLLVTTSGDPQAGEGVDAALLGTTDYDNQQVVTYNGWPLYYFVRDQGAEEPQGNGIESFGGEWFLLSPVGQIQSADVSAGERMYARACAHCHGRTGRGMASFPSLTGKDADYIASRLMQYRAGETIGPNTALMRPVAARLSDEDIANLAAFVSTNFQ